MIPKENPGAATSASLPMPRVKKKSPRMPKLPLEWQMSPTGGLRKVLAPHNGSDKFCYEKKSGDSLPPQHLPFYFESKLK